MYDVLEAYRVGEMGQFQEALEAMRRYLSRR